MVQSPRPTTTHRPRGRTHKLSKLQSLARMGVQWPTQQCRSRTHHATCAWWTRHSRKHYNPVPLLQPKVREETLTIQITCSSKTDHSRNENEMVELMPQQQIINAT